MQRLYSMFPTGIPGCGLLILRLVAAASLHLDASGHFVRHPHSLIFTGLLVLSIMSTAGLLTPLVAVICGAAEIVLLFADGASVPPVAVLGPIDWLLLLLLGPGAYSLDARLFGRRVLIFDSDDSAR